MIWDYGSFGLSIFFKVVEKDKGAQHYHAQYLASILAAQIPPIRGGKDHVNTRSPTKPNVRKRLFSGP